MAAESTVVGERWAVVNHSRGRVAPAVGATARSQIGPDSVARHLGFGLPRGRSDCWNPSESEPEPDSSKADGAAGWAV